MKTTFKVSYYLRSNYENKEGKSPVMLRIYLGGEKANLGSTKIFVDKSKWSNKTSRMIGRTAEALSINASIDALTTTLMQIYRKYETSEELSIDLIRSVFLGTDKEYTTFLPVFDKYIDSITQQVGKTLTKCTFYKYKVVRQNFQDFLQAKYHRKDIGLTELTSAVVQDFELYLTSVVGGVHNTTTKKMKYYDINRKGGKVFPMLSNQRINSYLKEIADLCGIKKNLTFHMARHTLATMSISKGVPMESVSKMLGHTNIRITQIYARITNKKVERDMEELTGKLSKFNTAMGI